MIGARRRHDGGWRRKGTRGAFLTPVRPALYGNLTALMKPSQFWTREAVRFFRLTLTSPSDASQLADAPGRFDFRRV